MACAYCCGCEPPEDWDEFMSFEWCKHNGPAHPWCLESVAAYVASQNPAPVAGATPNNPQTKETA